MIPLPPPGVVHIWYAHLNPPDSTIAQMEQVLSADEWAQLRRFHFADDARRYAVRRGMLRHLLAGYLQIPPTEIVFAYGPQRKPTLAPSLVVADLRFNLSDSGEMAVYSFAVGQEIGVDIEAHRDYPDALQLAERFFSREEAEWLKSQPAEQRSSAFLRCWTCKEAVVKALGDGLMAPLQEFTVAHWQTPPRLHWPASPQSDWSIHLLRPPDGYSAALAAANPIASIHEQFFHSDK
jgi:4'-phosphopantetheinyl transferase